MTAKTGAPLTWNVQITDGRGNPTPEFMRRWEDLRAINSSIPQLSTPAQVSALLDILGNTRGSILYRSAAGWALLLPGTSGQLLETLGPGNDPQWTTFTANIQALLDSIGSTRGDVLFRGAGGWSVLAPGTAGQVLTTGGAGADPSWAAGGGGGGGSGLFNQVMSATPTSAGTGLTSWFNQGSATVADSATGICITAPSSGGSNSFAGRYKAAPAAPYTVTALLTCTQNSSAFGALAFGWYDGTKLHHIEYDLGNTGAFATLNVNRWSNPTTYSSTDITIGNQNNVDVPIWFQLSDDGTNVYFRYGTDGANFFTAYQVAKASGFLSSYSNIMFANDPVNSQKFVTLMSYKEHSP